MGVALLVFPALDSRYLAACAPLLIVVACLPLAKWQRLGPAYAVLLLTTAVSYQQFLVGHLKEDYESAFRQVTSQWQEGDCVVSITGTFRDFGKSPADYYLRVREAEGLPVLDELDLESSTEYSRIWAVIRPSSYANPRIRRLHELHPQLLRRVPTKKRIYVELRE